ncbi:restriction endonuclease subunit S [Loktanella sp. R86503]|uniref:restriction endonuclease subunit S n=1 Tax=Loktanella sp. R86503 TaxID=3093847 RepID=UPI0036D89BAD
MKAGWNIKPLGDVCSVTNGGTPKSSVASYWGGDVNWLTPKDMGKMDGRNIGKTPRTISDEGLASCSARLVPSNSVIMSTRAPIGHLAINDVPMAFNQGCRGMVPGNNLDSIYLFYFLSMNREALNDLGTGATFKELSSAPLKAFPIPLPPLEEQQRIVAVLDEAFEGLARARAHAEANLQNAQELLAVVLDKIFASDDPSWKAEALSELCMIGDGNHSSKYPKKSEMVADGVPFLRSSNIQNGAIDRNEMLYISDAKHAELKKGHLKGGDVLFTNRGEIGKVAIVPEDLEGANLNSQVAWLRCGEQIDCRFLFFFLQSGRMKRFYLDTQSGAALQQFTIKMLKAVSVSFPPRDSQKAAVHRIDQMQKNVSVLESSYQALLQDITDLRQSILHRAFAGELT